MQRIRNIIVQSLLSPEFVGGILLVLIYSVYLEPFSWLGEKLISNNLLGYSYVVPLTLLGFSLTQIQNNIIIPDHRSKKVYYNWEDYQKIKDNTYIGVVYIIIGLIASSYLSLFENSISKELVSLLLAISYVISIISCGSMFFAAHKVDEILERYT